MVQCSLMPLLQHLCSTSLLQVVGTHCAWWGSQQARAGDESQQRVRKSSFPPPDTDSALLSYMGVCLSRQAGYLGRS